MRTAYPFPFGTLFLEYEGDVLNGLTCREESYAISEDDLQQRTTWTDTVMEQVNEYLQGKRKRFELAYRFSGTVFQQAVWKALLDIPYGETRSYQQIAVAIGKPNAVRAIGMANHKNPLMLLIPCHRVIGTNGSLTGYAGGLKMKAFLLELEKKNQDVNDLFPDRRQRHSLLPRSIPAESPMCTVFLQFKSR